MSTDTASVAPVVADGEPSLPYPPQFIMPAPVAPAEVTEAIGALRVACAQWASSAAAPVEVHACDTVLGRHTEACRPPPSPSSLRCSPLPIVLRWLRARGEAPVSP